MHSFIMCYGWHCMVDYSWQTVSCLSGDIILHNYDDTD